MADNVDITAVDPTIGKDATVAADVIATVAYQRVKLTLGADGVNDGDVSTANPIPVTGSITAASTLADGSDVNAGAKADVAIVSDADGTISGKVRGLVKILADVWNSVTHKIAVDTGLTTQTDALTNTQLRATAVSVTLPVDSTATPISTHDSDLDTGSALILPLGSQGVPLSQDSSGLQPEGTAPLLVSDRDLQVVFGSQSLLSSQRLKVESGYQEQLVQGILRTALVNTEVIFNCEGFNSLTVELSPAQASAWTGTVTFEALMSQTWYAMIFQPAVVAAPASTATVSGIFRFNIAGYSRFRVRTSTAGTLNAFVLAKLSTAPGVSPLVNPITGSQLTSLSQRATTFETNTYDTNIASNVGPVTALVKDALTIPEWQSNGTYNIGDTVLWNGQVYRCFLSTVGITPIPNPNNATYFVLDQRQSKSLVTNQFVSPANAPRLRVEIDLDDYQNRMAEETLLAVKLALQNQTAIQEYQLEVLQAGVSNGIYYGKSYAMQSGMSSQQMDEIR